MSEFDVLVQQDYQQYLADLPGVDGQAAVNIGLGKAWAIARAAQLGIGTPPLVTVLFGLMSEMPDGVTLDTPDGIDAAIGSSTQGVAINLHSRKAAETLAEIAQHSIRIFDLIEQERLARAGAELKLEPLPNDYRPAEPVTLKD